MIKRACECGASLHVADLDGATETGMLDMWRVLHDGPGHQPVTMAEATTIRFYERRRRHAENPSG